MARVLVIDDEEGIRRLLRSILETEGYTVDTAPGSRIGLDMHENDPYDLIITDIFMPDGDGLQALMALQPAGGGPPVIAISGGSSRFGLDGIRLAQTLGAARVLRKPFRPSQLMSEVRAAMGAAR